MIKDNCFLFGTLIKTYRVSGEYILKSEIKLSEKLLEIETVFIEIDKQLVPFLLDRIEFRADFTAIIRLENIDSDQQAVEFLNHNIYIPVFYKPDEKKSGFKSGDITGFMVFDNKYGEIGTINRILEIPGNSLIQVYKDAQEILIPYNPKNIIKIDLDKKCIIIVSPEGLYDIS